MKHIVDHPRTRSGTERLVRYSQLDLNAREAPSAKAETLTRQPRERQTGVKLRRFAEIARRDG